MAVLDDYDYGDYHIETREASHISYGEYILYELYVEGIGCAISSENFYLVEREHKTVTEKGIEKYIAEYRREEMVRLIQEENKKREELGRKK